MVEEDGVVDGDGGDAEVKQERREGARIWGEEEVVSDFQWVWKPDWNVWKNWQVGLF